MRVVHSHNQDISSASIHACNGQLIMVVAVVVVAIIDSRQVMTGKRLIFVLVILSRKLYFIHSHTDGETLKNLLHRKHYIKQVSSINMLQTCEYLNL